MVERAPDEGRQAADPVQYQQVAEQGARKPARTATASSSHSTQATTIVDTTIHRTPLRLIDRRLTNASAMAIAAGNARPTIACPAVAQGCVGGHPGSEGHCCMADAASHDATLQAPPGSRSNGAWLVAKDERARYPTRRTADEERVSPSAEDAIVASLPMVACWRATRSAALGRLPSGSDRGVAASIRQGIDMVSISSSCAR